MSIPTINYSNLLNDFSISLTLKVKRNFPNCMAM